MTKSMSPAELDVQDRHRSPTTQDGDAMDAARPRRNCYGVCQFSLQKGPDGKMRHMVQRLGLDEFGREWDTESWHSSAFSRQTSSEFSRQSTPGTPDDPSAAAMREFFQAGAKQELVSPTACTSAGYASSQEPAEGASDDEDLVELGR
eukprot:TRINITY_DN84628_c0_g1_i1.p1 TRINITY_DN84628_c0_g1~~TRINITY_DN84628_c0_g1_i1.p1  ORF type:complete len:148 (-),score=32.75 TRINITY_DN84628_c0_g1_i1:34-477(-)